MGHYRLFVSHAHKDAKIAFAFIAAVEAAMKTEGRILCTSLRPPEYADPNVEDVSDLLHDHLNQSTCVVGILTPNSIESAWCLFELGGAWMLAKRTFPLLVGIKPDKLPAALKKKKAAREAACLTEPGEVSKVLADLRVELDWELKGSAQKEIEQLVAVVSEFPWEDCDIGLG
jgi:hypothetical protein